MNNALLKDNLAARAVDSQTRKVFSRSGLIAGLCLSSLVSSYAIPGGVDATKAKNESVMITQQAKRVSGVVTDSAGEPIPGANVVQKETTNGTVTDMNGKYTLDVPNNATLVISFIGYTTKEIKVGSQSVLNVSLVEEAIGLNEVVAIGYGYVKKKDLTGAVSTVSADDMVLGGTVSNAAQALQGKTAGVQVSQSSKAPGGTIAVRVRGNNSISSTNEPLYVVDGFPSSEGLNLNPNDIESMQILKDASATAIYGARGANGVVLITTKRGKAGENKISYSGYLGTQKVDNPFEFLNAKDYMNLQNALYQEIDGQEGNPNGVYTPSQLQSTVDTDWLDVCTRLALVQDHNIQFRGGSEKTKVLTSLGYYKQEGVLKNTDFNRISGRVNVDQTINDFIKAGATMYAHRERSNAQTYSGNILGENVMLSVMEYDPTVKPYNEDGTYGRVPGGRGDNPLANLLERKKEMVNDKFNGTAFLEVNPFDGFTAKATAGVELLHNFKGSYLPKSTTYAGEIEGGIASTYDFRSTRQVFEGILQFALIIDIQSLKQPVHTPQHCIHLADHLNRNLLFGIFGAFVGRDQADKAFLVGHADTLNRAVVFRDDAVNLSCRKILNRRVHLLHGDEVSVV